MKSLFLCTVSPTSPLGDRWFKGEFFPTSLQGGVYPSSYLLPGALDWQCRSVSTLLFQLLGRAWRDPFRGPIYDRFLNQFWIPFGSHFHVGEHYAHYHPSTGEVVLSHLKVLKIGQERGICTSKRRSIQSAALTYFLFAPKASVRPI